MPWPTLLRQRDRLDQQIANVTGRSARQGDVGEFIASRIFDIELASTAVHAGYDGVFRSGPHVGRTVNIKTYGDAAGLDIGRHPCDFYLILSGPARPSGQVQHHRWRISAVYLFEAARLRAELAARGVRIGIATSLRRADLDAAQIFPIPAGHGPSVPLTSAQLDLIRLFA